MKKLIMADCPDPSISFAITHFIQGERKPGHPERAMRVEGRTGTIGFLFIFLINISCFSMELNYPEKHIPIFSNNSNQPIFLDISAIEHSQLLKTFFEQRKEYKQENITINFNHEDLKTAIDIINIFVEAKNGSSKEDLLTNELQDLSLQDLINTYFIIDLFKINELEEYLGLLFNKPEFIEQLSKLDEKQLQLLDFIKVNVFLLDQGQALKPLLKNIDTVFIPLNNKSYFVRYNDRSGQLFDNNDNPVSNILNNINHIYWSRNGSCYFIKYDNESGQLFDNNGNSIGNILNNINYIYWSPDGSSYFVEYSNGSGQLFNNNGNSIGNILNNIKFIYWSRNGSSYFVRYNDGLGQLFNNNGNSIGDTLRNINYIYWSPDGSSYFVEYNDGSGQLFNNNGNAIGNKLNNINYIYWSPDGSSYFVEYSNGSGQLFNNNGNAIGNILNNINYIYWSRNGSSYFVRYNDGLGQLFNNNGNSIGDTLRNINYIYWSPDGSSYFVEYNNGSGQLFNNNGNAIGNKLNNIKFILWSPNGSSYFVEYSNGPRQLFNNNGKSILYLSRRCELHSVISNNALMLVLKDNLYRNNLKFLVKDLANGYQIYRAKDKLPIGKSIKNKPLWLDTNTFLIEEDGQEKYYSYQELPLPDLVNTIMQK